MSVPQEGPKPSLALAILPIALTLGILALQLFYYGDFTPHVPLALGLAVTAGLAWLRGYRWQQVEEGALHVVSVGLQSIGILLTVGIIIGVWIASGTVPTLVWIGLKLLTPELFLAAAMLLCAIVSVFLGTSWGTTGTVGLALMGIGGGFDIPAYWTAGAVVSGAFFGDKVSPLSDTTNLAPAVTSVNLFSHIRGMMPTTLPAMVAALVIYLVAGYVAIGSPEVSFARIEAITRGLADHFVISGWLLAPPILVVALAVRRMPALPTLFAGALLGGVLAMLFQGAGLHDVFHYAFAGYGIDTGVREIDELLNRGGIQSMSWVIALVLIALAFGGALERTRCLEVIIEAIMGRVRRFAALQSSAIATSVATNLVAGDPYLSIALPGRMYAPVYRGMGYSTLNLSRATEEGGTLISPLVPWNAGGAFVITALGLGVFEGRLENLLYIPLSFACWLSPLIGIAYAWLHWFSPRATDAERARWEADGELVFRRDPGGILVDPRGGAGTPDARV